VRRIGLAQAVDALPAAVEVVEAVVLLVDHDDVTDPVEPVGAAALRRGALDARDRKHREQQYASNASTPHRVLLGCLRSGGE
jgi:hypothetical protein